MHAELAAATPLRRLRSFERSGVTVYAKCEFQNPGGSVKDRIANAMIDWGEACGSLRCGMPLVEATAGNTGLALALAGRLRGYRTIAVMSSKMSAQKVTALQSAGAQVEIVPYIVENGTESPFIRRAREIASEQHGWYVDQFGNPANPTAHFATTGPEIWRQSHGTVTALVAGIGTGGTLTGAARYLRTQQQALRTVLADPEGSILAACAQGHAATGARPYRIEGIGGDFVPKNADLSLVTDAYTVSDREAFEEVERLIDEEGLFVGPSSGCALVATRRFVARCDERHVVVVMCADSGRAY